MLIRFRRGRAIVSMGGMAASLSGAAFAAGCRAIGRIVAEGRVRGKRRNAPRGPKDGRFDDIDDADDIDDPRTEGRRRRVRQVSRTPEGARKAEGGGCALRRGVVDVVDVVESVERPEKGTASPGRAASRLTPRRRF